VSIRVADSGPGFSEEERQRLFEPFFTTKPAGEGLGLGLAISQDIVREFGGELKAELRSELRAELTQDVSASLQVEASGMDDASGAVFIIELPGCIEDKK
jgi:signal transduction histidine kinase